MQSENNVSWLEHPQKLGMELYRNIYLCIYQRFSLSSIVTNFIILVTIRYMFFFKFGGDLKNLK